MSLRLGPESLEDACSPGGWALRPVLGTGRELGYGFQLLGTSTELCHAVKEQCWQ